MSVPSKNEILSWLQKIDEEVLYRMVEKESYMLGLPYRHDYKVKVLVGRAKAYKRLVDGDPMLVVVPLSDFTVVLVEVDDKEDKAREKIILAYYKGEWRKTDFTEYY